jgi:hypothetical protein
MDASLKVSSTSGGMPELDTDAINREFACHDAPREPSRNGAAAR